MKQTPNFSAKIQMGKSIAKGLSSAKPRMVIA
jgi:hypothetical protein